MIIYRITNSINGKSYIGQTTKTLEERWKQHLANYKKLNFYFYRAIRKYGINCWKIEIIEEVEHSLLNDREQYWIAYYNTMKEGYNMNTGGGQNSKHSPEVINKLKQIIKTKEQREKMSLSAKIRMSREKKTGESNRAFKRYYFTPWGKYPCISEAYSSCPYKIKISKGRLWHCCTKPNKSIKGTNNLKYFSKEYIGKTYKELGFNYEDIK